jgi:hypothetical protein
MTGLSMVRMISDVGGRWTVRTGSAGQPTDRWQDKSAAFGRTHMVGWAGVSRLSPIHPAGASAQKGRVSYAHSAISHLDTVWRRP